MPDVIIFDVNETLLDMSALDPHFERIFGNARVRRTWFQQLKELWHVGLVTNHFTPFGELAGAALRMTGEMEEVALSAAQESAVVNGLKELPPHAEVGKALGLLRNAGFSLGTLTNGSLPASHAQLEYAGLMGYFDRTMSAEEVKRHKPAREPYEMAANRFNVEPRDYRMVAAHAWDIAGAAAAGCATAFIARPRKVLNPAGPAPDVQASDLLDLARRLPETDRPKR